MFWICLAVGVVVLLLTVSSVRRDARWLGNAYLIGLSGLLVLFTGVLAIPGLGLLVLLTGALALVLAPLSVLLLVGFLIANGLTMLRRERRSLPNLLSLLAGLGIAAVMAASLVVLVAPGTPLTPLALAAVLALAYLGVQFTCIVGYAWAYARIARRVPATHVIVLGAGLRDGRTVGPLLAGRVDAGIDHYRRQRSGGRPALLVLSGGQGPDEHVSEARAMADHALTRGVPPEHLILEDRSATTLENLRFTRALLAAPTEATAATAGGVATQSVAARTAPTPARVEPTPARLPWFASPVRATMLVVTSDYHALRAATYAREVGLPAHAVGARTAAYFWPSAILREFVALINRHRVRHVVLLALVALPMPLLLALVG